MKLKEGEKMLDYLKMVSSILIVLLIISVTFASTPPTKIKPLFDDKCESVLNDMGNEVANIEWDFDSTDFKYEIMQLEKVLKKNNVKTDDYYLAVMKFRAIDATTSYYIIVVGCIIRGIQGDWKGKWTMVQGDDSIIEEIEKRESSRIFEKSYL